MKKKVNLNVMISKSKAKFIKSLQQKKVRDKEKLFIIEGDKIVKEYLQAKIPVKTLVARPEFISELSAEMKQCVHEIVDAGFEELKQISTLKTPHNALAVATIHDSELDIPAVFNRLCVALDFVQDPGNFGTIIRGAAWFGIKTIVCSRNCVDVYNPKVIQATMGAFLHVNIVYCDLKKFLTSSKEYNIPVFGTLLDGVSIYDHKLDNRGIILLGNESRGISADLVPFITERIMIPGPGVTMPGIESLNVSMAACVVFSEFLRKSGTFTVK